MNQDINPFLSPQRFNDPGISLALEFKHPVYVKQIALEFFTHILFRFHRRPPEI